MTTNSNPSVRRVAEVLLPAVCAAAMICASDQGFAAAASSARETLFFKQWDHAHGGFGTDELTAAIATADGGYLLGGWSDSYGGGNKTAQSIDFGFLGRGDYWVVKTDPQGNKQWDRSYGGTGTDRVTALQTTVDGGFLIGGWSDSSKRGNKTAPHLGAEDFWLVKIGSDGAKL